MAGNLAIYNVADNAWNLEHTVAMGLGSDCQGVYWDQKYFWVVEANRTGNLHQCSLSKTLAFNIERTQAIGTSLASFGRLGSISGNGKYLYIGYAATISGLAAPRCAIFDRNFNYERQINSMSLIAGAAGGWYDLTWDGKKLLGLWLLTGLPGQYYFTLVDVENDVAETVDFDFIEHHAVAYNGKDVLTILEYGGVHYGVILTKRRVYQTTGVALATTGTQGMDYGERDPITGRKGKYAYVVYN